MLLDGHNFLLTCSTAGGGNFTYMDSDTGMAGVPCKIPVRPVSERYVRGLVRGT